TIGTDDGEYFFQKTFTFSLIDVNEFVQPADQPNNGEGGGDAGVIYPPFGGTDGLDNVILDTVNGMKKPVSEGTNGEGGANGEGEHSGFERDGADIGEGGPGAHLTVKAKMHKD